ncbi:LLM class flavin-dependent oxidoreductase [Longirhabdus pacifica]|uniref:LLM class flavin-dependent oxidoreductase n=1 Tax=Longirhabdus pacifica TaxID=2305227 RepID=UPI00100881F5|nr:LLM class flavin-dependent oxidoreductase [Longirhabdus pacifica]
MIQLSVLDQSPIVSGQTAKQAIGNTVLLAQHTDQLGYHRFWVSEHHQTQGLGGSAPEILVTHLAEKTTSIRIGTGGVMLPHYSAYKVAEVFRLLETMYPNRIDLGVGRAPGGMPLATKALQEGKYGAVDRYPEQVEDLIGYLTDQLPENHRFAGLQAMPITSTAPELWMLGSSNASAIMAASKGTAYSFAQFINGNGGVPYVQQYKEQFRPSAILQEPKVNVGIFVICAETDEEAELIASSLDLGLLLLEQGIRSKGIPDIATAQSYSYSELEKQRVWFNRQRMIVGGIDSVKQQLLQLSDAYGANELIVVTITHDMEHKLNSYRLLAEAFGLQQRPS